jgi:site-specific recombinase XerD
MPNTDFTEKPDTGPVHITTVAVCRSGAEMDRSSTFDQVRIFIQASKAESTLRGYRTDWAHFCSWCEKQAVQSLPASPEAVARYIADCTRCLKTGSIQRRLNAIAEAHKAFGVESPCSTGMVRATLKGIRRTLGTAVIQKTAALTEDVKAMVNKVDEGPIGVRDRALMLLGFAGAFRRSELVALNSEDCLFSKDGLVITLRRSKTDQLMAGRRIGVPYGADPETCPIRTTEAWMECAGISSGALFRSINRHGQIQPRRLAGLDVARVIKKLAHRVGLDAASYAGHSLRSGHATSAAIAGATERSIMRQTGHQSVQMLRRYIREGTLFRDNSAAKLGL